MRRLLDFVELVEQHDSTHSTRRARLARHVERFESCRDVTWRDEPSGIWLYACVSVRVYVYCCNARPLMHRVILSKWRALCCLQYASLCTMPARCRDGHLLITWRSANLPSSLASCTNSTGDSGQQLRSHEFHGGRTKEHEPRWGKFLLWNGAFWCKSNWRCTSFGFGGYSESIEFLRLVKFLS